MAKCLLCSVALYFSVSVTDPTSYSPGHADWDLPALLSGMFVADLLRHLVADLVLVWDLVALLVVLDMVVVFTKNANQG